VLAAAARYPARGGSGKDWGLRGLAPRDAREVEGLENTRGWPGKELTAAARGSAGSGSVGRGGAACAATGDRGSF
jgi:hypothetical protein